MTPLKPHGMFCLLNWKIFTSCTLIRRHWSTLMKTHVGVSLCRFVVLFESVRLNIYLFDFGEFCLHILCQKKNPKKYSINSSSSAAAAACLSAEVMTRNLIMSSFMQWPLSFPRLHPPTVLTCAGNHALPRDEVRGPDRTLMLYAVVSLSVHHIPQDRSAESTATALEVVFIVSPLLLCRIISLFPLGQKFKPQPAAELWRLIGPECIAHAM